MEPINHYLAIFCTWTWTCSNSVKLQQGLPLARRAKKEVERNMDRSNSRGLSSRAGRVPVPAQTDHAGGGGHRPCRFKAYCSQGARRTSRGHRSRDTPVKTPSSGLHLGETTGHPAQLQSSHFFNTHTLIHSQEEESVSHRCKDKIWQHFNWKKKRRRRSQCTSKRSSGQQKRCYA